MKFNLASAKAAAEKGQLQDWALDYISSGDWANMPLFGGLQLVKRYWVGPVALPLADMKRVAGPEPDMPYPQDRQDWERRVTVITSTLSDINDLPPLILEINEGIIRLADGSHRHEALRRLGHTTCWCIIWYNDQAEYEASPYL